MRYYNLEDVPARWDFPRVAPEVYRRGQWHTYPNIPAFIDNAVEIDKAGCDGLVRESDARYHTG